MSILGDKRLVPKKSADLYIQRIAGGSCKTWTGLESGLWTGLDWTLDWTGLEEVWVQLLWL